MRDRRCMSNRHLAMFVIPFVFGVAACDSIKLSVRQKVVKDATKSKAPIQEAKSPETRRAGYREFPAVGVNGL